MATCVGRFGFIASLARVLEKGDVLEFVDRIENRDGDRERRRGFRSLCSSPLGERERPSGEIRDPLSRTSDLDRSRGGPGGRRSFPRRSRPRRGERRLGAPRPGNRPRPLDDGLCSRLSPCWLKEGRRCENEPPRPRGDGLRVRFRFGGGPKGDSSRNGPGLSRSNGLDGCVFQSPDEAGRGLSGHRFSGNFEDGPGGPGGPCG